MICSRCAHWNDQDEHRCLKCAARLNDRQVESAHHSYGALALQPSRRESPLARAVPVAVAVMERPEGLAVETLTKTGTGHGRIPRYVTSLQQSLFALRNTGKVILIDGTAPERRPARKQSTGGNKSRLGTTASYLPQHGILEFVPMATPQTKKLATSVDARIFCEDPVASVSHRMLAALYDLGLIALLVMTFLGILYWGCEDLASAIEYPMIVVVLAGMVLIGLLYHSVYLAARGETPGMRAAELQLVDFNGRRPSEAQLHMRVLGGFVSVLAAGLGLLWALVDEEGLTWQDQISHTYPTSINTE